MSIQQVESMTVPEGDSITVRRLMPLPSLRNFDPFVLFDHFDIANGGFPEHPHRGFEAITWLFAGGMRHTDNLGNAGTVHAGGAQAFTAGSGIVHSEFPVGRTAGIQLWVNLPQRLKSITPAYQQIDHIAPTISYGIEIRSIVGHNGAIRLHTPVEYLDIRMCAQSRLTQAITAEYRGIIYVVAGELACDHAVVRAGQALLLENETECSLHARERTHLLWCFGKPHCEPVHQHGPFVD